MKFVKSIKKYIYNNTNIKILNILKQFNINIKYYDIGASGGLQPRANNFFELLNPILVEAETSSFSQLKGNKHNLKNCVLWSEEKEKEFFITNKQQVSSIYEPNFKLLNNYKDTDRFNIIKKIKKDCTTLDKVIENDNESFFMKIDTQGSEYEILKGGESVINNAIGFEIEIEFKELYLDQPQFKEVNQFLVSKNFILMDFLNIVRWERDNFRGFGEIVSVDALYLKSPEHFLNNTDLNNEDNYTNLIRYVIILAMYKRLDLLRYLKNNLKKDYKLYNCIESIVAILEKRFSIAYFLQDSLIDRLFRLILNDSRSAILY